MMRGNLVGSRALGLSLKTGAGFSFKEQQKAVFEEIRL